MIGLLIFEMYFVDWNGLVEGVGFVLFWYLVVIGLLILI